MQYVWTQGSRGRPPLLEQEDLVFIDIDACLILNLDEVLYTDGNAASDETTIYCAPVNLTVLDWRIIRTPNCYSIEYKRKKASEVLVPNNVPLDYFSRFVVYNENALETIRNQFAEASLDFEVVVNLGYYY